MELIKRYSPGILLTAIIAVIGVKLSGVSIFSQLGFSGLTIAIIVGIIIGNTLYRPIAPAVNPGLQIAKGKFLRLGIILYSLKITFQQIESVGIDAITIDVLVLSSTLCLAYFMGTRIFHLDRNSALLIGAGSSICGAAAVMAVEPVVKPHTQDEDKLSDHASKVSIAIATVVVFGTLSMFIYPIFFHMLQGLGMFDSQLHYGIYVGSTVHEVAQVYAAGQAIGSQAADTAVIVKMIRVMMIAPVLLILSGLLNRSENQGKRKITIPWFAILFIVMAAINSLGIIPANIVKPLITIDTILLSMAMAGLGISTQLSSIKAAGVKPLLLGSTIFIYLIFGGGCINLIIRHILG